MLYARYSIQSAAYRTRIYMTQDTLITFSRSCHFLPAGTYLSPAAPEAHPICILILKCGQNLCDLALVQYQEVYLWFLNNKLFSVTGSKFANLCDFVAEISIAENIYHGTSTDLANLNLGNLNLGDVHIFSTAPLWKSPIHWSTPRRRRIKKINNIKTKYFTHQLPIGCPAANPGSKKASYTKSPKQKNTENCRISAAANLV